MRAAALLLAGCLPAVPLAAQGADSARAPVRAPRIGVALSGGSAKGFAHIGVLRVLEQVGLPVHVVTGTSMGAVVGGLYAIGYTPDMVEQVALEQDWAGLFRNQVSRRQLTPARKAADARYLAEFPLRGGRIGLPAGLVSGQAVADLLTRLTRSAAADSDFTRLPIAFAAVATDLATGEAAVLTRGSLAEAMRASMALPSIFAPVSYGGRRLIDGGGVRNLPAQDARDLGADLVICVDVSDPLAPVDSLQSALDVILQTVSFQVLRSNATQRLLCNLVITPDLTGLSSTAFDQAGAWVARGQAAADAVRPRLAALADSVRALGARRAPPGPATAERAPRSPDSVYVRTVRVTGGRASANLIETARANIGVPRWFRGEQLDETVERLYATGHFERVTYTLVPGEAGATLVLTVEPRNMDAFGVGVRYESQHGPALLVGATLHDQVQYGSVLQVDLRLGDPSLFDIQFLLDADGPSRWPKRLRATYVSMPLDLFLGGRASASERITTRSLSAMLGHQLTRNLVAAAELRGEVARNEPVVAPPESLTTTRTYWTLGGLVWLDTYDRTVVPTRGVSAFALAEASDGAVLSGATFARWVVDLNGLLPLGRRLSLIGRVTAGAANGADLPRHMRFYLGGATPMPVLPPQFVTLAGLKPQAQAGERLSAVAIGAQRQFGRDVYVTLRWNAGATFPRWPDAVRIRDYVRGMGLTVTALSPAGPLSLTAAWRSLARTPDLTVDLGFRF